MRRSLLPARRRSRDELTWDQPSGFYRNLTNYGDPEFSRFLRRAFLSSAGLDRDDLSRPVVGIVDTSSDFTTCHRQMPELVEAVRRGILEAGGIPMRVPSMSLGEILISPTSMLYRNLLAMETEEQLTAYPMDAAVLVGGCDKTVPAQMMAACSANVPSIQVVAGPMLTSTWRGERLGACTDCRRQWAAYRAGQLEELDIAELEQVLCPTAGTCMVMGTASTMACIAEAMGLVLPGGASAPAPSADRLRNGVMSGRRAVSLARDQVRPRDLLTPGSFHNALVVLTAIGGSTNAVIHLLAIAGRARVTLSLNDFDQVARQVPLLVDCKPSGIGYMEYFHQAGGMPTLLKTLEPLLDLSCATVAQRTLGELLAQVSPAEPWQTTIRTLDHPLGPTGSLAVVRGSLAPDGAVIKASAASPELMRHTGPALVLNSEEDIAAKLDGLGLEVTRDHVLVLRNAGPVGAGMPEAGSLPIPRHLAEAGVRDMVRVSDARMSGTAFGTVVLHCSPEAARGGPLALVQDGDLVRLDVPERRLDLLVDEVELERRRAHFEPPPLPERGWKRLYADHVMSAHLGADLDFLV
ncbi:MAG: dihydroxy-acid dehydratase [Candidatus Dormibacteraceae bacterium]